MANFSYYNSKARKNHYSRRLFKGVTFWFLSILNMIVGVLVLLMIFGSESKTSGLFQIVLSIILLFQGYLLAKKYSAGVPQKSENLADRFTSDLLEYFEIVIKEAQKESIPTLSSEYFFANFSLTDEGKYLSVRLGMPAAKPMPGEVKTNQLPQFSTDIQKVLIENFSGNKEIDYEDFVGAIAKTSNKIGEFLSTCKLSVADLEKVLNYIKENKKILNRPKFWQDETTFAGLGQDWSYGYTPTLSLYSYDLSKFTGDPTLDINVFGHTGKLTEIQRILARPSKNNVLLVGEPGVGKKTIVNALAKKMARGDCLESLRFQRIRQLDVGELLAGAGPGELERRLERALSDAVNAGNIILFIENFQSLLGSYDQSRQEVGGVDASQILIPFLSSGLRIIAVVSPDDFFDRVRSNTAIAGAFEKIEIQPATVEETESILLESLSYIETKYNVFVPFQTIKKIALLSDRYIKDVPLPEKALRLLEESAVNNSTGKMKVLLSDEIERIISERTSIPVSEAQGKEADKLLNLEKFLHQRVVGQDEALSAIANALRRARAGLSTGKRPVGVFLFLGPTGVGKTETAKALAESYFGKEKNMIRLDMSEYQISTSIDRLIGTVQNPNGVINTAVLENPFSLILLDELEKADKNILNLFLQVFEDGRLTDPRGKICDFTNTIIIATSNAGSEFIRENVSKLSQEQMKENLINMLQEQGIFTPEFLNRFDGVVVFKPLSKDQLLEVAKLMLENINKTLTEKKIIVSLDPAALQKVVTLSYSPEFGARPMRRVFQDKVENILAKKMLEGKVSEGGTLQIQAADIA